MFVIFCRIFLILLSIYGTTTLHNNPECSGALCRAENHGSGLYSLPPFPPDPLHPVHPLLNSFCFKRIVKIGTWHFLGAPALFSSIFSNNGNFVFRLFEILFAREICSKAVNKLNQILRNTLIHIKIIVSFTS